ncbi:hypothetical protein [Bradyrhizobium sp. SEMIA]|nr:hypothetical protein [Bradyrhizobium sp. SEMIA]
MPELGISNIHVSLSFWQDLLGFEIADDRSATTKSGSANSWSRIPMAI